ncbi:T9SS type A sorting domain-containing protein [Mesonia sp.]|uniref:T9SS type A sorting domain-containing protein n=1 Tax=Mesonia sp. TaxID=1960830 RepID=UPI003F95D3E0
MQKITTAILFLFSLTCFSQTTQITDPNFEKTLIDLGIDSDGIVNGQVLTSDIAQVTHLDLSTSNHLPIETLTTGVSWNKSLKGFTSLKVLNVSGIGYWGGIYDVAPVLDLTEVTNLEELYFTNTGTDFMNEIYVIFLGNNPNLKVIESFDTGRLSTIDLKGSDLNTINLNINLEGDTNDFGCCGNICVNVTNPVDAQNEQGLYANWNVIYTNNSGLSITYSDDCDLFFDIKNHELKAIKIYPNPVTSNLYIETTQNYEQVEIYTLQGRLIKSFLPQEHYNIAELPSGLYFVKVKSKNRETIQKLIKN